MKRNMKPPVPAFIDRLARAGTRPHAVHRPNPDGIRYGIPKAFRRHAKRYGQGVAAMASMHKKFPVEKLG